MKKYLIFATFLLAFILLPGINVKAAETLNYNSGYYCEYFNNGSSTSCNNLYSISIWGNPVLSSLYDNDTTFEFSYYYRYTDYFIYDIHNVTACSPGESVKFTFDIIENDDYSAGLIRHLNVYINNSNFSCSSPVTIDKFHKQYTCVYNSNFANTTIPLTIKMEDVPYNLENFNARFQYGIMKTGTYECLQGNQAIIENNNQNTNKIIENNNQNTDKIIENNDKNTQQIIDKQDETNKNLSETKDYLTSDEKPESDISSLGNVQGLLPPGPVDSLLNIPFKFLSIVVSSLGDVCVPLTGTFVFNSILTIPCFSTTFYDQVPDDLMIFINLIPSGFILISYLKHLYKKVDRAVSLQTNSDDEWGVL